MLALVNSSGLMRVLPGPAVAQVPPHLSGSGHPLRQPHHVGTSTPKVFVPASIAVPPMFAASVVAGIQHPRVIVPNFVPFRLVSIHLYTFFVWLRLFMITLITTLSITNTWVFLRFRHWFSRLSCG